MSFTIILFLILSSHNIINKRIQQQNFMMRKDKLLYDNPSLLAARMIDVLD